MLERLRQKAPTELPSLRRRRVRTALGVSVALIFGSGCASNIPGHVFSGESREATSTTDTTSSLLATMVNVAESHRNAGIYSPRTTTTQPQNSVGESTSSGTVPTASPDELKEWYGGPKTP